MKGEARQSGLGLLSLAVKDAGWWPRWRRCCPSPEEAPMLGEAPLASPPRSLTQAFCSAGRHPPAMPLLPVCSAHALTHCSQWHTWPAVPLPSPWCTRTEAGSRLRASFAIWGVDPGCLLAPQLPFNNIAFKEAVLSGDFPRSSVGEESVFQCRRPQFNPWVRKIPYRMEWQPTLVFFPGKFHGQGNLAGYSPWGRRVRHN